MTAATGREPDEFASDADDAFDPDAMADLHAGFSRGRDPVIPFPGTTRRHEQPVADEPRLIVRRGCDVVPLPVSWLWPGWLAAGKLQLIAGAPGTGKTTLAVAIGAVLTVGGLWPDGSTVAPGDVLMWSGEDDDEDTLNPRFRAAGADMNRVWVVSCVQDGGERYAFDPARDMPLLRKVLLSHPNVRLVIIDPVVSAVAGDSHKNAEVRRGLQPLVDLAEEMQCAVLGITHLTKGSSGRDPIERVTGSLAFGALPRLVMLTAKKDATQEEPACRMLLRAKSNIGEDGGGFTYSLAIDPLPDFPDIHASRVVWGDILLGSAHELLSEIDAGTEDEGEDADAPSVLRAILADGPRPANEVYREAKAAGFSAGAMRRARKKAGVSTEKDGMKGPWMWTLR